MVSIFTKILLIILSCSSVLTLDLKLIKRTNGNQKSWSFDDAKRFLLNDENHSLEHSHSSKEEAYRNWENILWDRQTISSIDLTKDSGNGREENVKANQDQSPIKQKKKRVRLTAHQKLIHYFLKQGLNEEESWEKATEAICQRGSRLCGKDLQKKTNANREKYVAQYMGDKNKERRDQRNARRRERYLKRISQKEKDGQLKRPRRPEGESGYDIMHREQVGKQLKNGLSRVEAEREAQLYTAKMREKRKEWNAKTNARRKEVRKTEKKKTE